MFASDLKHRKLRLEEKLRALYALNKGKKIDLSFRAPYLDLLKAFGNPERKLPPVIHVAGTNGKGSIIAALRSILETERYKVHAYTSPHLEEFNERIYLAGKFIADDALENLIDRALDLNKGADCTFFEITTAMAFAAFAESPADILLLETGLGGRLDCTNVIESPLLTIISAIGYDHMEFLGDNLRMIAGEKAGIMKPGVPCVIAQQTAEAIDEGVMNVFEARARETGLTLYRAGAEWVSETKAGRFRYRGKFEDRLVEKSLPRPNLAGEHQVQNCGAAVEALGVIAAKFPVSDAAIEKGLRNIKWPGRLQDMTAEFKNIIPLVNSGGWEVWLDGGHNENAAKILSAHVENWRREDGKPLHLIVGMMNHKKPEDFIAPLMDFADSVTFVDIPDEPHGLKAGEIATIVQNMRCSPPNPPVNRGEFFRIVECGNFIDAVMELAEQEKTSCRILIAGSLYLAGHVLKTIRARDHNGVKDQTTHAA